MLWSNTNGRMPEKRHEGTYLSFCRGFALLLRLWMREKNNLIPKLAKQVSQHDVVRLGWKVKKKKLRRDTRPCCTVINSSLKLSHLDNLLPRWLLHALSYDGFEFLLIFSSSFRWSHCPFAPFRSFTLPFSLQLIYWNFPFVIIIIIIYIVSWSSGASLSAILSI